MGNDRTRWRSGTCGMQQLGQMPSKVQCECPHHLADLLTKLNAFERYSLEFGSTNIKDAAMHEGAGSITRCDH